MPRKYSMMRTDLVAPPKDGAYDTAMKDLVRELAANGVETLAFFGSYGDAETRDVAISRVEIR